MKEKDSARVAAVLRRRMKRKMAEHYRKAVEKHPYFCDRVIDHFNGGPHTKLAVDECYDCVAVMLRMIDVLEGRQPLGKPSEGKEAN